ncbi:GNAT family N-acetyltransferase [Desulfosediminicola ganghwensis]|uniref:GNAT family N-acetyltransferase n=1 Tax=Desulfosediminicola ganghwensis TaxID=2569540 RepID=UPI001C3D9324|nr:GNAT family N-acetyltransferase [Desulfosediminicola ganghwensis]
MMKYTLHIMTSEHREAVMNIFNYYIENSMAAYRQEMLPLEAFDRFLKLTEKYPAYVAQAEDKSVMGFGFLSAHKDIVEFSHTAEFTCFLHPGNLGIGMGGAILTRLESEAKKAGITNILASISSLNDRSLVFHEKHGFQQCGRFYAVGEKNGRRFDTIWMQKLLN